MRLGLIELKNSVVMLNDCVMAKQVSPFSTAYTDSHSGLHFSVLAFQKRAPAHPKLRKTMNAYSVFVSKIEFGSKDRNLPLAFPLSASEMTRKREISKNKLINIALLLFPISSYFYLNNSTFVRYGIHA